MEQELGNVSLIHLHQRVFMIACMILDLRSQKIQEKAQVCDNYALQVFCDYAYQYTKLFQLN